MEEGEDSTGFGFLAGLIILVVVLLLLGYFYYKMEIVARSNDAVEICRHSVDLSSMAHVSGVNLMDELECPAVTAQISDSSEDKIKQKVAMEMADCWYKFGGDSKELFDKNFGTERFCAVCSELRFSGSAKDRKIDKFITYLSEKQTKSQYGKKTYLEFLNTRMPADLKEIISSGRDSFDTSNDYAVIFVYDKTGNIDGVLGTAIGAGGGAAAAIITGLMVVPEPLVSKAVAGAIWAGVVLGGASGYLGSADTASSIAAVTVLMPYSAQTFDQLNCEKLPIRQDNK
jgi:hypothetical protein